MRGGGGPQVDYGMYWSNYMNWMGEEHALSARKAAADRAKMSAAGITPTTDLWEQRQQELAKEYGMRVEELETGFTASELKSYIQKTSITQTMKESFLEKFDKYGVYDPARKKSEQTWESVDDSMEGYDDKLAPPKDYTMLDLHTGPEAGKRYTPEDQERYSTFASLQSKDKGDVYPELTQRLMREPDLWEYEAAIRYGLPGKGEPDEEAEALARAKTAAKTGGGASSGSDETASPGLGAQAGTPSGASPWVY